MIAGVAFVQDLQKSEALPKIVKSAILHDTDFEPTPRPLHQ